MGVGYSQFPSKMLNLQLLCFSSVNAMCSQEKLLQSLNLGVFPVHPHTQHCLLMLGADASATGAVASKERTAEAPHCLPLLSWLCA